MQEVFKDFNTGGLLKIGNELLLESYRKPKQAGIYIFIRTTAQKAHIEVDGVPYIISEHSLLALTPIQFLHYTEGKNLVVYQFNREFYCIKDHDQEVSCAGLLFFGNAHIPVIDLGEKEQRKFDTLHEVFVDELETEDTIQAEMLRMLMARFMIMSTRLLKAKEGFSEVSYDVKVDLLRGFNLLVEEHYKSEHSVSFYADKLYKSPKTLSNTFSKFNTTPLQIIHERIILEAKRLLI